MNFNLKDGLIVALTIGLSSIFVVPTLVNNAKDSKILKEENQVLEKQYEDLVTTIEKYESEKKAILSKQDTLKKSLDSARETNPNVNEEIKYAYLTFDDGPSENTEKILDFLKANDIKATFFPVVENNYKNSDEIYKRIIAEGHTLAIHSYSHDYAKIYQSEETLVEDFNKAADYLQQVTGVRPVIARLPGGSTNTISSNYGGKGIMEKVRQSVLDAGFSYFDWNVDSGDALKFKQDKNVIVNNVVTLGGLDLNEAVILMHDAKPKTTTVDALPEIVEGLRKQGFVFKAITKETTPVRYK